MRETLIVIGLVILAVAMRSCRATAMRKLGAAAFLLATYALVFFLTGSPWWAILGIVAWFFLPWIELLTRIQRMRLPVDNRLRHREIPNESFFPNACEAIAAIEEAEFDHVDDCGWEWAGMQQFFRLYWHPEEQAVAAVCLCEQTEVAFAFLSITTTDQHGRIWRTTNFPFSPTLRCMPGIRWNHVPCERNCFHQILADHHAFLRKHKIDPAHVRMPDPDLIEANIEEEMRSQIQFNLDLGIIVHAEDGTFRYSLRGLIFLWGQFIKDMVRLC
jgi:hypothetical protein